MLGLLDACAPRSALDINLDDHHSYGHLLVMTGYFYGIIHAINGVISVHTELVNGHNCRSQEPIKVVGAVFLRSIQVAFE